MKIERKYELADNQHVTLNGKPAWISGVKEPFAMVRTLNGAGFEFAWETVERVIIEQDGKFKG